MGGVYTGSSYIDSSYLGLWVVLKAPSAMEFSGFRFSVYSSDAANAPGEWKVYGSADGVSFVEAYMRHV